MPRRSREEVWFSTSHGCDHSEDSGVFEERVSMVRYMLLRPAEFNYSACTFYVLLPVCALRRYTTTLVDSEVFVPESSDVSE